MPIRTVSVGPRAANEGELRITLGISGALSVTAGYAIAELSIGPSQYLRLRYALANVDTPSAGSSILLSADYSTDGGESWIPIIPALGAEITEASRKMVSPFTEFDTSPLDLPSRCLVRGNIDQIGSGTAGSDLKLQLKGDVWSV